MFTNRFISLTITGALMLGAGAITALPAAAATHGGHHRAHHRSHHSSSAIPQHNGGDRDVDNNGGPSDGDGNA
ncbi:MAG TPA: hypothetical protein VGH78_05040 [Solirubrobacteraceae bacterium]|jgi:hypothetical protein